ncbi:hypothetical protein HGRIS_006712 [Hohenbuehelia grisea]|uniref:Uncharacterized protein n=1 Tax=Hohenbuehelia grisea TaxID=104357 RepID=A0ABR3J9S8_9AGAR
MVSSLVPNIMAHRSPNISRSVVLASVQHFLSSPVSAQLVHDLQTRLESRYFKDDIVCLDLVDEWFVVLYQHTYSIDPSADPFQASRSRSRGSYPHRSCSIIRNVFKIDHAPHRAGLDLYTSTEDAKLKDNPWRYLYRVFLFEGDPVVVSADRLTRDLGFLTKAIVDRLSAAAISQPSSCCPGPRDEGFTSQRTSVQQSIDGGAPLAQFNLNFTIGNSNTANLNVNTGSGTFVSNAGPGSVYGNYGAGTFNNTDSSAIGSQCDDDA